MIGTLVVAAACLIAMVYALSQGNLWLAGLDAFFAGFLLMFYRRDKRSPSPVAPEDDSNA